MRMAAQALCPTRFKMNCPSITLSPLPNGTVMTPYSQIIAASGGDLARTISVYSMEYLHQA